MMDAVLILAGLELLFILCILALLCRLQYRTVTQPVSLALTAPDWRAAQERAEALLKELLTPEEYGSLRQRGYLEVPSPSRPQRTYRIPRHQGQVKVIEHGTPVMALCVQPVDPIPEGDIVLMHKLMIEANEDEYLRIANRFEPTFYGFVAVRPRT